LIASRICYIVRLAMEDDLETVRTAALLLEAENKKLVAKNVELTRELLKLKGVGDEQLTLRIAELERQLAARNKALFGKSSEKRNKGSRRSAGKQPQSGHGPKEQPNLRGVEETVELGTAASTVCEHCRKPVVEWDNQFEESEEVDVISREFVVKRIKRKKARCKCCRTIVTASPPAKLFPGARYSIAFAVLVVVSKYADHLPLERQVKMMARDGLNVDSQTLWDYVWAAAQLLKPAHQRLLEYVLASPVIGVDETWWRLMGAKPKAEGGQGDKWWIWSACTHDAVFYRLEDSRSADAARKLIGEYKGVAMCDGYSAYVSVAAKTGIRLAHCWSHVRRKYHELDATFTNEAQTVLDLIDQLFAIEALCPTGPPGDDMRSKLRNQRSRPLVKQIEQWALSIRATPESPLRKAIEYMGSQWKGLLLFLDDPRIPLHNNASERALRAPVIGRVNHFGSRSSRGTEAAGILYSLIESAKLAGVEPSAYLDHALRCALKGELVPLPHEIPPAISAPTSSEKSPTSG
jgi:transposase